MYFCCYLAIGIIETTSFYISETCSVTLVPLLMSICWLGVLIALLSGLLFLYSVGTMYSIGYLDNHLQPDLLLPQLPKQVKDTTSLL